MAEEAAVAGEAAVAEEEEAAAELEMVVKGELEPESLKVPLPVWQSQELMGSDSQQNPLFPQSITPASEISRQVCRQYNTVGSSPSPRSGQYMSRGYSHQRLRRRVGSIVYSSQQ